jgi:hypothetical protein
MKPFSSYASILMLTLLFGGLSSPARAQLFSSGGLDPTFCKNKSIRQTVVYIDDMLMVTEKTNWVEKLVAKLKASLSPGERTTVVRLSPADGHSSEIWSGCWPAYTLQQRDQIVKNGPYILQKNPLDALEAQQAFFVRDFDAAVSKIYFDTKRPSSAVLFKPSTAPKKNIIRAIASDEARFANSPTTLRVVIYSDMAENSDLGSVFGNSSEQPVNYAEKLGTHLRKSVFYAFGVGDDVVEASSMQESARSFWTRALKSMSATIAGFGGDLTVSNGVPISWMSYATTLKEGDQELSGLLSVLTDTEGNILDSWIGFSRLNISGLKGTFRCEGDSCVLDGLTTTNLVTNDADSEVLTLMGTRTALSGQIGIKGTKISLPVVAVLQK